MYVCQVCVQRGDIAQQISSVSNRPAASPYGDTVSLHSTHFLFRFIHSSVGRESGNDVCDHPVRDAWTDVFSQSDVAFQLLDGQSLLRVLLVLLLQLSEDRRDDCGQTGGLTQLILTRPVEDLPALRLLLTDGGEGPLRRIAVLLVTGLTVRVVGAAVAVPLLLPPPVPVNQLAEVGRLLTVFDDELVFEQLLGCGTEGWVLVEAGLGELFEALGEISRQRRRRRLGDVEQNSHRMHV